MQEIVCEHTWTMWFENSPPDNRRWRVCRGLCKTTHYEGDAIPRIAVARIEESVQRKI